MLGAMRAIALLKPAVRVLCVICSCENMPSGRAYKPGDVLTAMSGKTIEVLNTDAEGRLVLADGLHYAQDARRDAADQRGHADRSNWDCARPAQRRAVHERRRDRAALLRCLSDRRREVLADALHRRLPRPDQELDCGHHEHRRIALWRRDRRRDVPERVRRRYALDSSRHRREPHGWTSRSRGSPRAPAASACAASRSGRAATQSKFLAPTLLTGLLDCAERSHPLLRGKERS